MKRPEPAPGLVIRYDFLWSREQAAGKQEGVKDRPCVVVAAIIRKDDGETDVLLVPVTHSAPTQAGSAIAVPDNVNRHLGLDDAQSYVVTDEANTVSWNDPGIVPARPGRSWAYGRVPKALFEQIRSSMLGHVRQRRLKPVQRKS